MGEDIDMKSLILAVMLAVAGIAPAGAASEVDWLLVTYTGGPEGASQIRVNGAWIVDAVGEERMVFGEVWALGRERYSDVENYGSDNQSISAVTPLGNHEMTAIRQVNDSAMWGGWRGTLDRLEPGETLALLLLTSGFVFRDFEVYDLDPESGMVDLDVVSGSGSARLALADGSSEGVGVQAAGTAVADVVVDRNADTGIVGAFGGDCLWCTYSYTPPGGSPHSINSRNVCGGAIIQACLGSTEDAVFAGPSGAWRFGFNGAREGIYHGGPTMALYAPVGDASTLFDLA